MLFSRPSRCAIPILFASHQFPNGPPGAIFVEDEWLGSPDDGKHYGDISVQLRGPIVRSIQSASAETGMLFVGEKVFPPLEPAGNVLIHAAFVQPEGLPLAVKILHHAAICLERKRIWIQNPYFILEPKTVDAFGDAVRRGEQDAPGSWAARLGAVRSSTAHVRSCRPSGTKLDASRHPVVWRPCI